MTCWVKFRYHRSRTLVPHIPVKRRPMRSRASDRFPGDYSVLMAPAGDAATAGKQLARRRKACGLPIFQSGCCRDSVVSAGEFGEDAARNGTIGSCFLAGEERVALHFEPAVARVLVIEEKEIVRRGVTGLLHGQAGITVVGEAASVAAALAIGPRCAPTWPCSACACPTAAEPSCAPGCGPGCPGCAA